MSRVAGIVLAAGPSRRFGGDPAKQLARFDGEPLVRRAARTALASRLDRVLIVVGHESASVGAVLAGLAVEVVENPSHREGQSTSVRAALSRLGPEVDAAIFLPVDQPWLTPSLLDRLIERFDAGGAWVVTAADRGRRRAPALVARRLFERLRTLTGDAGARQIFAELPPETLASIEPDDPIELADVDVAADLARLRRRP